MGDVPDTDELPVDDAPPERSSRPRRPARPPREAAPSPRGAVEPPKDAGAPEDPRSGRRHGLTIVAVALLVIAGAVYYAASYWRDPPARPGQPAATARPAASSPSPTPTCASGPSPREVRVSVLNAGRRTGLATRTGASLRRAGFTVLHTGNDTTDRVVSTNAELRFGPDGRDAAATLARFVPGAARVEVARRGTSVDLVIGPGFSGLPPTPPTPTAPPAC